MGGESPVRDTPSCAAGSGHEQPGSWSIAGTPLPPSAICTPHPRRLVVSIHRRPAGWAAHRSRGFGRVAAARTIDRRVRCCVPSVKSCRQAEWLSVAAGVHVHYRRLQSCGFRDHPERSVEPRMRYRLHPRSAAHGVNQAISIVGSDPSIAPGHCHPPTDGTDVSASLSCGRIRLCSSC